MIKWRIYRVKHYQINEFIRMKCCKSQSKNILLLFANLFSENMIIHTKMVFQFKFVSIWNSERILYLKVTEYTHQFLFMTFERSAINENTSLKYIRLTSKFNFIWSIVFFSRHLKDNQRNKRNISQFTKGDSTTISFGKLIVYWSFRPLKSGKNVILLHT